MKIEDNGDEKITVALSQTDMNELDITYEDMDYSNIETRRVIWTVLDEARRYLGKPLDTDGRLLIEVSPRENGGCVMYFTSLPGNDYKSKKKLIMKKDAEPILFCAFSDDAFLDALNVLENDTKAVKSYESYIYENDYYVIVYPNVTYSAAVTYELSEYGELYADEKIKACKIFELGTPLKKASGAHTATV